MFSGGKKSWDTRLIISGLFSETAEKINWNARFNYLIIVGRVKWFCEDVVLETLSHNRIKYM